MKRIILALFIGVGLFASCNQQAEKQTQYKVNLLDCSGKPIQEYMASSYPFPVNGNQSPIVKIYDLKSQKEIILNGTWTAEKIK